MSTKKRMTAKKRTAPSPARPRPTLASLELRLDRLAWLLAQLEDALVDSGLLAEFRQ